MVNRQSLIIGAAYAVMHQYYVGQVELSRAIDSDPYSSKWIKKIKETCDAIKEQKRIEVSGTIGDVLAHLQQSMRVSHDEWEKVMGFVKVTS